MDTMGMVGLLVLVVLVLVFLAGWALTRFHIAPDSSEPPVIPHLPPPPALVPDFRPSTPAAVVTPKLKPETVNVHLQDEKGRSLGSIKLYRIRRRPTFQYRTPKDGKLGNYLCINSHSASEFTYRRVSVEREG